MEISYKKIRLLPLNPRYTRSTEIDLLNINYGSNYNIRDTISELLSYEGEWDDLLDLLEQLMLGYNPAMDQIFILKGKDQLFYSIEGNRRIMCMYLITEFSEYKCILEKFSKVENYKKVVKILESLEKPSFNDLNVTMLSLSDIKSEDEIWKIIYTRHAGENKGKRSWSRLKYFYDLKDMFFKYKESKIETKEIKQKLSYRFNKSIKSLDTDLNDAVWLIDVVDYYNRDKESSAKININEKSKNISALELARSVIKIEYNDELKTLSKLFEISVRVEKWEVTIKLADKKDLYNFLVKNLKSENYTTRGWEEKEIFVLYEFVLKYLEPNSISSSTLRQEIELANQTPFRERTAIQQQLIKYSDNASSLKNIHKQLLDKKEKITGIKWALFQIWKNNTKPLFETLKIKSENYPFLISSIVIRTSLELLSTFAILNSNKFRSKIIEIWNDLSNDEKEDWNKNYSFDDKKLIFVKKDSKSLEIEILKKFRNDNLFEIVKKNISMKKIKSSEILDMIYEDMKIDRSMLKYKILKTQIGYLDNFILGKNNNIPNVIIHCYHYLEDKSNFELAWISLNTQLELIVKIIKIWLLNDLNINE